MSNPGRSGTCMQATLVGLIDNRAHYEQLLHACRAMSGKPEQHLLHKESVYKASPRLFLIAFRIQSYAFEYALAIITCQPTLTGIYFVLHSYSESTNAFLMLNMITHPQVSPHHNPNPGSRSNYQLLLRLGKIPAANADPADKDKYVQPMSLIWVSDVVPCPSSFDKHLRGEESKRRLPKPSLRKIIEVEVGAHIQNNAQE